MKLIKFEKFATPVVWTIFLGGLLFLVLSSYGLFNNFISFDAKYSPLFMKIIGSHVLLIAIAYGIGVATDRIKNFRWSGALFVVLVALAVCINVNFSFAGKDKTIYVTIFHDNGAVKTDLIDDWIEENKEQYLTVANIDITAPEFKEYVLNYGELPGRNKYNSLIRAGKAPRSNAPRANEDFPLPYDLK